MHYLTIHYFLVSPYKTLNNDKILFTSYNTLSYNLGRCSVGREIRWYFFKIDLELDYTILPTFSLLNHKDVSNKLYKMFKSFTYYPLYQHYFEFYSCVRKRKSTYITSRLQRDSLTYLYFLFFFCSHKNYKTYFNTDSNKFNSITLPNIHIYKDNLTQKDYGIKNNKINITIKRTKKHLIKEDYS